MAHYTIAEIIDIAKVSGYLTANDIDRGNLFGERLDPQWALRLYLERRAVEWMHTLEPNYAGLTAKANYLFALCGGYGRRAAAIVAAGGSGTVITPVSPEDSEAADFVYRIPITGADFYDSTEYRDPRIVGHSLGIEWNEVDRNLYAHEFTYTPNGIRILVDGFDAQTTHADAHFVIYINDPDIEGVTVSNPGGSESSGGTSVEYPGGAATYALPANTVLNYMIVFPASDTNFMIGTSVGLDDVLPDQAVVSAGTLISLNRYGGLGGETLYLAGLPAGSRITYFTTTPNLS